MKYHCVYNLNFFKRCRRLPKALKEWDAFNELKQKIDDFNECCPLLELMANKAMKQRHWDRLEQLTGHHFDILNENFCLRNIMEAPLLKHKEDIEVMFQFFINEGHEYDLLYLLKQSQITFYHIDFYNIF